MPYKKGPNGTLRKYGYHGRYCKESIYENLSTKKFSKSEKERIRKENLYNKALNSKDKLLADVFLYLENQIPGCIISVNEKIYDKNIQSTRETDLETKKLIIEIKSGKVKHKFSQLISQKKFAETRGKTQVVYAPDMKSGIKKECIKNGILVVDSLTKIAEMEKKKK